MIEDIDGLQEEIEFSKKPTETAHLHNVLPTAFFRPTSRLPVFSSKAIYASGVRLPCLLLRKEAFVYVAGIRWHPLAATLACFEAAFSMGLYSRLCCVLRRDEMCLPQQKLAKGVGAISCETITVMHEILSYKASHLVLFDGSPMDRGRAVRNLLLISLCVRKTAEKIN